MVPIDSYNRPHLVQGRGLIDSLPNKALMVCVGYYVRVKNSRELPENK